MTASEVRLVAAWHEALNDGDIDRLVELSHPEIEVGGPRGTGRGVQLLREWVARAEIQLDSRRIFHRAETVVVEQEAKWREAGQVTQILASAFVVSDGRISRVTRYPDLARALGAVGLDERHELGPIGSG